MRFKRAPSRVGSSRRSARRSPRRVVRDNEAAAELSERSESMRSEAQGDPGNYRLGRPRRLRDERRHAEARHARVGGKAVGVRLAGESALAVVHVAAVRAAGDVVLTLESERTGDGHRPSGCADRRRDRARPGWRRRGLRRRVRVVRRRRLTWLARGSLPRRIARVRGRRRRIRGGRRRGVVLLLARGDDHHEGCCGRASENGSHTRFSLERS